MNELQQQSLWVEMDYEGKSLKSQMRRADKLGARYSVVIGEAEVASGRATFKRMVDGEQVDGEQVDGEQVDGQQVESALVAEEIS